MSPLLLSQNSRKNLVLAGGALLEAETRESAEKLMTVTRPIPPSAPVTQGAPLPMPRHALLPPESLLLPTLLIILHCPLHLMTLLKKNGPNAGPPSHVVSLHVGILLEARQLSLQYRPQLSRVALQFSKILVKVLRKLTPRHPAGPGTLSVPRAVETSAAKTPVQMEVIKLQITFLGSVALPSWLLYMCM
jgi:hypothetical protein